MLSAVLLSAIALAQVASAHPASPLAVATVKQQFTNALIVPAILPAFEPTGTVILNFTGAGITTVGQALTTNITSVKPQISMKGTAAAEATAGGPFNVTTGLYTVMMIDGFVPGNTNNTSLVRHYLQNNIPYGVNNDHAVLLAPVDNSTAITNYAGPAPPSGSGPHRYIVLVFSQPASFVAPAGFATSIGVGRFDPNAYITSANLTLLAANYFTVAVGETNSTVSVAATSSVDSTTLPQYTPTSSGASATGTALPASTTSARSSASQTFWSGSAALSAAAAALVFFH